MSSSAPRPRWKQLIANSINTHIKDDKTVLYHALATTSTSTSTSTNTHTPHVRYVVHRGFLNEDRSKDAPTGTTPAQPDFATSSALLTTSDVRAPKVAQLVQSGGAAELAWWHDAAQLQFRIAGQLYVLPRPDHEYAQHFPRDTLAPPRLSSSSSSGDNKAFDWEAERMRVFAKMSPALVASFARPIPGSEHPNAAQLSSNEHGGPGEGDKPAKDNVQSPWPLELPQPAKLDKGEAALSEEQKRLLEESKRNFALLVLDPHTVDVVDLARDKRSRFERVSPSQSATGSSSASAAEEEWTETRLVP